jgi:hypothetical protein
MSEAAAQYWRMRAALAVSDALPPANAAAFSAALVVAEKNNLSIERAMKWPANWRIRMMASGDEVRGEPGDSRIRQVSRRHWEAAWAQREGHPQPAYRLGLPTKRIHDDTTHRFLTALDNPYSRNRLHSAQKRVAAVHG